MNNYTTAQIRNVGLFAHSGVGKTTLGESMLYLAEHITRKGSVEKGNTTSDSDPEEIERKISIYSSILPVEWNGVKINFIDTPGFMDFWGEVKGAMQVIDSAVVLVSAVAGIEVGTETIWMELAKTPKLIFINGMDKENADFQKIFLSIKENLEGDFLLLQIPIGKGNDFRGIVNLLSKKAIIYKDGKPTPSEVPSELISQVEEAREKLMEGIAENDEELMEIYCGQGELTEALLDKGIKKAITAGAVPVLCGSAQLDIGVKELMEFICKYFPSPLEVKPKCGTTPDGDTIEVSPSPDAPLSAFVFNTFSDPYMGKLSYFKVYSGIFLPDSSIYNSTKEQEERVGKLFFVRGKVQSNTEKVVAGDIGATAKLQVTATGDTLSSKDRIVKFPQIDFPKPVISLAIYPKTRADEDKLGEAISKLCEEDPTLKIQRNVETKEFVMSGLGELQLTIMKDKLKRRYGVNIELKTPKVPYKETISKKVQAEGKHKKQSGGRGQYGHVWLELEPLPRGEYFEFVNKIVGGVVPKNYIPSVEKGVIKAMETGPLAGYPVTDVKVTLYDGSYHTVDSSDIAFQIAASLGFRKGVEEANPVILEPIYNIEVIVPSDYMGDVMGDLNSKRGKILGMETKGKYAIIKASVPYAELLKYSIDLRSLTQGRGRFSMEFSHYQEVPPILAEGIIEQRKLEQENK